MNVGITGHQNLGPAAAVRWVTKALSRAVEQYNPSRGISCLAAGADQLFTEILLERGIPYLAVIPCTNYEGAFAEHCQSERYRILLSHAEQVIQLEFAAPSEEAFLEAGKRVVDLSDLLFSVWDGRKAVGLGGTSDITRYAISTGKRIVQFNPIERQVANKER